MKNLEIKVQVNTFDLIRDKLAFAKDKGFLIQKDTYYFFGNTKLKSREESGKTELIFYIRPKINGSRESRYIRFGIPNFLKKILSFIFGEKIIVNKERLLLYKHTRIHLDKVNELGKFIELETVFNTKVTPNIFIAEHNEVKKLLGLEMFRVVSGSYSDLLLKKQKIVN